MSWPGECTLLQLQEVKVYLYLWFIVSRRVKARPGEVLGTMLHLNICWKLWPEAVNDFTQPAGQNKDIPLSLPFTVSIFRGLGWCSGKGTALLVGRSRDQFPVVSLDFSVTYFLPTVPWPWGRLRPLWKWVPGTSLGVKAAGAWGWRLHHFHVLNVMKIWEPKPPGTLWACYGTALPLPYHYTACILPHNVLYFKTD